MGGIVSDGVAGCLQRETPRPHSAAPGDVEQQTNQPEADQQPDDHDRKPPATTTAPLTWERSAASGRSAARFS